MTVPKKVKKSDGFSLTMGRFSTTAVDMLRNTHCIMTRSEPIVSMLATVEKTASTSSVRTKQYGISSTVVTAW